MLLQHRKVPPYLWLMCVFVFLQSCSTRLPPAGIKAYDQCRYDKAIEIFSAASKKPKDALLYDLAILSAAVHKGDFETAKQAGNRAQQQMWGYEGAGAGQASLVSSEALRYYKGEPFEKTMASLYLGVIYFNEQDYQNAKAAFTKAVFAVQTKSEDAKADFSAPYLLLAKTYLKLGDMDNARITLERLQKVYPTPSLTLERLQKIHTIAFVELGVGPRKIRTGPGDSLIGWQRQRYFDRRARVDMDGQPLPIEFEVRDDLTYQASTTDRGGKTAIQATKGVLREGATATAIIAANEAISRKNKTAGWVALGAGLFALANQSQADLRQWEFLPDRLDLLLSVQPENADRHEYRADFSGRRQIELPTESQVWYDQRNVDQDRIYIVRARNCGYREFSR